MKGTPNGRALTDRSIAKLFRPCNDIDASEYVEGLAFTPSEFRSVMTLTAAGWRRFLREQGLESQTGFDLNSAAQILAMLAWTTRDFVELLDGIRTDVGNDVAAALPVLYRRLCAHLSQHRSEP